jgi:hypothetical protein
MKTPNRMRNWIGIGGAILATAAYAQKEQWLEYHVTRDGRGYSYLELTTNAPPNVTLPKLNAKPYFARWVSPLDQAGGRWLCFDRTRKSGPYDRVYVDSKGDGKLANQIAIGTSRLDQYSAYFEPAKIVFKGEDGPITYHLCMRFMAYEGSDTRVLASSGGFYAGEVDFGGKKRHIELVDGNVNGTFNDRGSTSGDCDRLAVKDDKLGERYLGKLLEVDGQFFSVEVARDGAFIKLQKAEDVALGKVKVPEGISEFVALGEVGHFSRKPIKGEFTLPAGQYRILEWTIDRKDSKGAAWQLMGYGFNESATFEVAAGKPYNLEVGEPIRVDLQARDATNRVDFNLSFLGRFDESIQITKGGQRPAGPRMTLASVDGTYRSTNTFEFG